MLALSDRARPVEADSDLPRVWTRPIVREWLRDAATALKWLPDQERRWLADQRAHMPEMLRKTADLFAEAVSEIQVGDRRKWNFRHVATPEQIRRLHLVIEWGWCSWLDRKELACVWARAAGIPGRKLLRQTGISVSMQKHFARRGIEKIAARMNEG